jgi:MurNAc alpha-1-phosphate uridylyltransferase
LVVNGDVFTQLDFAPLIQRGLTDSELAYLVLVDNPEHHPQGDFMLTEQGLVIDQPNLTYSGISLLSPRLFVGCVAGKFGLAPLLRRAMADHCVSGYKAQDLWVDVGTPERLQYLETYLARSASC